MEIINQRFGLRRLLTQKALQDSESAISENALKSETGICSILRELAMKISKNPEVLFKDISTLVERKASWNALLKKEVNMDNLDSRSRPGHALLDHHMPHFWQVKNWKGVSVMDSACDASLMYKALWANLKMHSTPYASELRRSLIMVNGLSNVTKYRASVSKAIVSGFGAKNVLDPCIGWGGRMLGALAAGASYTGCEPSSATCKGLHGILEDIGQEKDATIIEKGAEEGLLGLTRKFDMVLTSPPYFNLELYNSDNQSVESYKTWDEWLTLWLDPIITASIGLLVDGGTSCWSVKNFKTNGDYRLADEVKAAHERAGWKLVKVVKMTGSGRPGSGRIVGGKESRSSTEETYCFQKP